MASPARLELACVGLEDPTPYPTARTSWSGKWESNPPAASLATIPHTMCIRLVDAEGFAPSISALSGLRRSVSAPHRKWSEWLDSHQRPPSSKLGRLTTDLHS